MCIRDSPYTEGNDTISVNRLTTNGEVTRNSIDYKIYADFNPTITAIITIIITTIVAITEHRTISTAPNIIITLI